MDDTERESEELSAEDPPRLRTNRAKVVGQLMICEGCCCGRTDRNFPPIPKQWLKAEWKSRKLNKYVQLTISGCLGPCDLANVAWLVAASGESIWLGGMTEQWQYERLLDWASQCRASEAFSDIPDDLMQYRFIRFDAASPAP